MIHEILQFIQTNPILTVILLGIVSGTVIDIFSMWIKHDRFLKGLPPEHKP